MLLDIHNTKNWQHCSSTKIICNSTNCNLVYGMMLWHFIQDGLIFFQHGTRTTDETNFVEKNKIQTLYGFNLTNSFENKRLRHRNLF